VSRCRQWSPHWFSVDSSRSFMNLSRDQTG
jgi:hypothetical protein